MGCYIPAMTADSKSSEPSATSETRTSLWSKKEHMDIIPPQSWIEGKVTVGQALILIYRDLKWFLIFPLVVLVWHWINR
jgi:hypothetical protein